MYDELEITDELYIERAHRVRGRKDVKFNPMGFFGAAHGWGEGQKGPPSLKSVAHILQ